MTPSDITSRLLAMGISPEAAARAVVGETAKVPEAAPSPFSGGNVAVTIPPSCWTIRIPDWHPPSENLWTGRHWSVKAKIKKVATAIVTLWVRRAGIPPAEKRRRVWLHLVMAPGQRMPDAENLWKAGLDALKNAGALKNDSPKWCAAERPTFSRGERAETFITVEDC